jgi:hypothetical protein
MRYQIQKISMGLGRGRIAFGLLGNLSLFAIFTACLLFRGLWLCRPVLMALLVNGRRV